jgi:hypothetical protein
MGNQKTGEMLKTLYRQVASRAPRDDIDWTYQVLNDRQALWKRRRGRQVIVRRMRVFPRDILHPLSRFRYTSGWVTEGPQKPSERQRSSQFNRIHRQGWWPGRSDRNHLQKCKYHMCSEFRVIEPLTDQAIANASCAGYQKHGQTPCSHLDTLSSRLPDGIVSLTRLGKLPLTKSLTSALSQYKLKAGHL